MFKHKTPQLRDKFIKEKVTIEFLSSPLFYKIKCPIFFTL